MSAERSETGAREIVITREYDAPRELVFAWTDPEHIVKWWGPDGFTNTTRSMQLRPGGEWIFVMHGPDGTDYDNRIVFLEIARPERIVFAHGSTDEGDPSRFDVTVTFEELGGRTRLTMRSLFPTAEARDFAVKQFGAIEGGRQTLARLGEQVKEALAARAFVLSRTFDAPRELVWKAWTEEERLAAWWGPKGLALRVAKLDLRPGGMFLYSMRPPNGNEFWGRFVFREVTPPERLAYVLSFSDEQGGIQRHVASPDWPLEMFTTVTFGELAGRTTITLRSVPINESAEERATFIAGFGSMQQGFGGTFDQLDGYLASA
jgi:uncharacterized protein YndB with AHSA1/START domain